MENLLPNDFFQIKTSLSEKSLYICSSYVDKFVLIATTEKNAKT